MSSTAQPFTYDPLLPEKEEIRLITIELPSDGIQVKCQIRIFCLDSAPRYFALSYTWGDRPASDSILLVQRPLAVRPNLLAALKRLSQKPKYKWVWIDALCIDQSNNNEKSCQIPLMGRIYSNAESTLVWLGDASVHGSLGLLFMQRIGNVFREARNEEEAFSRLHMLRYVPDALNPIHWSSVIALLRDPYRKRMWIMQEFVLSKTCRLLWRDVEIDEDSCFLSLLWIYIFHKLEKNSPVAQRVSLRLKERLPATECDLIVDLFRLRVHKNTSLREGRPFQPDVDTLIRSAIDRLASDPCDKIYGIYNMIDNEELRKEIQINYNKTPEEVFRSFIVGYIVAFRKLRILAMAGVNPNRIHNNPTWVPDFLSTPPGGSSTGGMTGFQASRTLSADFSFPSTNILLAKEVVCDEIAQS